MNKVGMNTDDMNIVVIGLGQIGGNMAMTLHAAGFTVTGTDVADAARDNLEARGLSVTSLDALPEADVYLLSLPTSAHVREVIETSPGLLQRAPKGSVIVDTSTSDPAVTRELAGKVVEAGLEWLDAPVSGGTLAHSKVRFRSWSAAIRACSTTVCPYSKRWARTSCS